MVRHPKTSAVTAYIGVGSNQGQREAQLQEAVGRLDDDSNIKVLDVSPVYETEAHTLDEESQPAYLNAVIQIETSLRPEDLLDVCQTIERGMGRDRRREKRWGARTIDLDILIYGSDTVEGEAIHIPHPRMGRRRFVLKPLVDLAPDLPIPTPYDATARDLLEACEDETAVESTPFKIAP